MELDSAIYGPHWTGWVSLGLFVADPVLQDGEEVADPNHKLGMPHMKTEFRIDRQEADKRSDTAGYG